MTLTGIFKSVTLTDVHIISGDSKIIIPESSLNDVNQVAALQWVRKNIEAFSGDPTRITIAGQQAGGASVHYHMLSPLTRGLFHQGRCYSVLSGDSRL